MENKKQPEAIIFFADGFEEVEAITVLDILRRAEITTSALSINKHKDVLSARGLKITCDGTFDENQEVINNARILILPGGGAGTENLKQHKGIACKIRDFNENGKLLAAICAAPSVFDALGVLEGKKATCYTGVSLNNAIKTTDDVVVDKNIITAKAAGVTHKFAAEIIKALKNEETAKKVLSEMFY